MSKLFLTILNMSLTASYVIIAVMIIRLFLKKAPKTISYGLWSVVAFRLLCPVSFESMFSLLPKSTTPISQNIFYEQVPQINTEIGNVDQFINNRLPMGTPAASINPIQVYIEIGAIIWVIGIMGMLLYSVVSIMILKRKLRSSKRIEGNVYEANNLKTPFVLGTIRPRVYLPAGLAEEERVYILEHELAHIKRYDHIIKPIAFFILALHWFNPLVWISFRLMGIDMELSCDERVLKKMDDKMKKPYANSLLSLAAGKPILNGSPLAFGEGNVKSRIENVLNYKKAPFWIIVTTVVMVGAASVGLLTNPKVVSDPQGDPEYPTSQEITSEPTSALWFLHQSTGADMAVLDYASDDIIIFHGYFGLYVYDLEKRVIIRNLDLQAINCAATQGDNYCDVVVSKDGNTVQLHPVSSKNMYVYTVSNHSLKNVPYEAMKNPFRESFVSMEDVHSKLNNPDGMGAYSYDVARFGDNEYGYLHSKNETLGTLSYRRGDKIYDLFADNDTVISSTWSVSATRITIVYTNPTDQEVLYGNAYRLEKMENEKWTEVPFESNVGWTDIGKILETNQSVEETTDLKLMHGDLAPGEYRLIRSMNMGTENIDVITGFILK